jgi:hypothetical protein
MTISLGLPKGGPCYSYQAGLGVNVGESGGGPISKRRKLFIPRKLRTPSLQRHHLCHEGDKIPAPSKTAPLLSLPGLDSDGVFLGTVFEVCGIDVVVDSCKLRSDVAFQIHFLAGVDLPVFEEMFSMMNK